MNTVFSTADMHSCGVEQFTWSQKTRQRLHSISPELSGIKTELLNVAPEQPYGLSYSVKKSFNPSKEVQLAVSEISDSVLKFNPKNGLMLFENMISKGFDSHALHVLFSLVADKMRKDKGNGVFHSPLKPSTQDSGFPVHADLFKPRALFNLITSANESSGGEALLLSRNCLSKAMKNVPDMPNNIRNTILKALSTAHGFDMFDCIFDLMHGDHPWVSKLAQEIEAYSIVLPARIGSGYFLRDGEWLHGRKAINGPVTIDRLQRLAFDTYSSRKMSVSNVNASDWQLSSAPSQLLAAKASSEKSMGKSFVKALAR